MLEEVALACAMARRYERLLTFIRVAARLDDLGAAQALR